MIKDNFKSRMMAKTGWGRNEIMAALDMSITEAVMSLLDKSTAR